MADAPVLVITGASTGIGASTARRAVQAGYRVVLGARSEDKLTALAEELGGEEHAIAQRCDVTDWEDQQALVATALERFGRLDAHLANAGFGAKRGFLEESVEHWRAMIDTNVYGVALSIRAVLAHFRETGEGHMLLMSSVAGRRNLAGSLYSASKWAVTAMGEGLRQEVEGTGVRVTLLEENGEYLDAQALTPGRTWVRYGGPAAAPVTTDGPLPETSDLVAGWYMIDVESHERAVELAAYVSSEPGPGGEPLYEWIDVREVMSEAPSDD